MGSTASPILTPEIIAMILQFSDRNTIAKLLPTCFMFWDIGASIVWETLDSLQPVIACMPEGLWRIEDSKRAWDEDIMILDDTTNNLILTRPIHPDDWDRAKLYCSRVRDFHYKDYDSVHFTKRMLLSLYGYGMPNPLFPNLTNLKLVMPNPNLVADEGLAKFLFLLSPTLRLIRISPSILVALPNEFPTILAHLSPKLEKFAILNGPEPIEMLFAYDSPIAYAAKKVLETHPTLEVACLSNVQASTLKRLASSETLQVLAIGLLMTSHISGAGLDPGQSTFSKLQEICLDTPESAMVLHRFLKLNSNLQKIQHMHLGANISKSGWEQVLRLVGETCSTGSLKTLDLTTRNYPHHDRVTLLENEAPYRFGMSDIQHLRPAFRSLQLLNICPVHGCDLSDGDLSTIADAAPNLQEISLLTEHDWMAPSSSSFTLQGLFSLLNRCRDLRSIQIQLDACGATPSIESVTPHLALENLFVGNSSIEDGLSVFRFLSKVAPNVEVNESWSMFHEHEQKEMLAESMGIEKTAALKYLYQWHIVRMSLRGVNESQMLTTFLETYQLSEEEKKVLDDATRLRIGHKVVSFLCQNLPRFRM